MRVRAATAADRAWIAALLESFGWDVVALRGELFRALDHPMLVAESDGGPEGLLTYILRDGECEILTLQALRQWAGVGSALVAAVRALAENRAVGDCTSSPRTTTSTRCASTSGEASASRPSGQARSMESRRRLKPTIPEVGEHGIPIRDEIELEITLGTD